MTEDSFPKDVRFVNPQGCDKCKTELNNCKCPEDPEMDGIHMFRGQWLCEKCLHTLGAEEFRQTFSERGAMHV